MWMCSHWYVPPEDHSKSWVCKTLDYSCLHACRTYNSTVHRNISKEHEQQFNDISRSYSVQTHTHTYTYEQRAGFTYAFITLSAHIQTYVQKGKTKICAESPGSSTHCSAFELCFERFVGVSIFLLRFVCLALELINAYFYTYVLFFSVFFCFCFFSLFS